MTTQDSQNWMRSKFAHIRIPKALLYHPDYANLSPEAMLLYGLMMDRTSLSMRFGGPRFRLADGSVTIIYTQAEIMDILKCRRDKARCITHQLADCHLIHLKQLGLGKPYQITVLPKDWSRISWQVYTKKPSSDADVIGLNYDDLSGTNNTDGNHTECNQLHSSLKQQINYDHLITLFEPLLIDTILDALLLVAPLPKIPDTVIDPQHLLSTVSAVHIAYTAEHMRRSPDSWENSDLFILQTLQDALMQPHKAEKFREP